MYGKVVLMLITLVLISPAAYAAPSVSGVSGTLADGASVTISGSGFGTKSPARPVLWDTFEGGADSSADVGSWSTFQAGAGSVVRRGSKSAQARCGDSSVGGAQSMATSIRMGLSDKVFISFWRRYTFDITKVTQQKFLRYHKDGGASFAAVWLVPYLNAAQEVSETWWGPTGKEPSPNVWYNEMYRLQGSSAIGSANGIFMFDRWNEAGTGGNLISRSNVRYKSSPGQEGDHVSLYLDNYGIGVAANSYAYYDDVYIDNTWARVMIGNNANFSSCTKFEMQIPTSWSSGSVTVTFNRGNFAAGSTAYLFVVDANNNAGPGYKITVGGSSSGGSSTPPPAPTNLRVVE